jgi:hypothetical protein
MTDPSIHLSSYSQKEKSKDRLGLTIHPPLSFDNSSAIKKEKLPDTSSLLKSKEKAKG